MIVTVKAYDYHGKSREKEDERGRGGYLLPQYHIIAVQFLEHCLIQPSIIPPPLSLSVYLATKPTHVRVLGGKVEARG